MTAMLPKLVVRARVPLFKASHGDAQRAIGEGDAPTVPDKKNSGDGGPGRSPVG